MDADKYLPFRKEYSWPLNNTMVGALTLHTLEIQV